MLNDKVFLFDDSYIRLDDSFPVNDTFIISDFLYGKCHIFALALAQYFGNSAECHCHIAYEEDNEPFLAHAYIKINDTVIDARGVCCIYDIECYTDDFYDFDSFVVTPEHILDNSHNDSWGEIPDGLIDELKQFISKHEYIYSGKILTEKENLELIDLLNS